jgi:hypothetical protein
MRCHFRLRSDGLLPSATSRLRILSGLVRVTSVIVFSALMGSPTMAALATTTTTLTLSSAAMSSGTTVIFTASVSNGSPVTTGQVVFCDANAARCADAAVVGIAQLTAAGTAVVKATPSVGNHSYKAIFSGTTSNGPSTSPARWLTVSGQTTVTISVSGSPGNYTLTGTVLAKGTNLSPTGSVSFVDTSDHYAVGSATLGSAVLAQKFGPEIAYQAGAAPSYIETGDFNGDGTTDLVIAN